MKSNNLKLLIVDDEIYLRLLMKSAMQSMGFDVILEAKNGQEAIECFQAESPDITLLDISMPMKSGIEALDEIKKINPNALVIMLTSLTDIESVEQCIEHGANGYIRKNSTFAEIKSLIQEAWKDFEKAEGKSAMLKLQKLLLRPLSPATWF